MSSSSHGDIDPWYNIRLGELTGQAPLPGPLGSTSRPHPLSLGQVYCSLMAANQPIRPGKQAVSMATVECVEREERGWESCVLFKHFLSLLRPSIAFSRQLSPMMARLSRQRIIVTTRCDDNLLSWLVF